MLRHYNNSMKNNLRMIFLTSKLRGKKKKPTKTHVGKNKHLPSNVIKSNSKLAQRHLGISVFLKVSVNSIWGG